MRPLLAVVAVALSPLAFAQVTLDPLVTDHAVLQRDAPISVRGRAQPGEVVEVQLGSRSSRTTARSDGSFVAQLEPLSLTKEPLELVARTASGEARARDLLVGDVWLCSGQSNMDWSLGASDSAEDVPQANLPLVRHFGVEMNFASVPQASVRGSWSVATPESVPGWTAVGFYFARRVHAETGVPIGLLRSTVGGTNIECWMSQDTLLGDPKLEPFAVRMRESLALTVTSALGNMVPMQAGLAGRIAYQHRVHGVPVTASVLIVVQATLLTLGAGVWIGLALLIVRSGGLSWAAVPASLVLVVPAALDANRPRSILCRVFLLRCMEVLVAGVRVHASLALTGCEADPLASLALGTAANLCNAIPVVGSAIGVREWCTALLAPTILGIGTPEVLMAQLLDRAAEIVLVLVGSAAAMPSLSRRLASTPTPLARVPFFETTPASTDTTPVDQRGAVVESLPKAEPPPSS